MFFRINSLSCAVKIEAVLKINPVDEHERNRPSLRNDHMTHTGLQNGGSIGSGIGSRYRFMISVASVNNRLTETKISSAIFLNSSARDHKRGTRRQSRNRGSQNNFISYRQDMIFRTGSIFVLTGSIFQAGSIF